MPRPPPSPPPPHAPTAASPSGLATPFPLPPLYHSQGLPASTPSPAPPPPPPRRRCLARESPRPCASCTAPYRQSRRSRCSVFRGPLRESFSQPIPNGFELGIQRSSRKQFSLRPNKRMWLPHALSRQRPPHRAVRTVPVVATQSFPPRSFDGTPRRPTRPPETRHIAPARDGCLLPAWLRRACARPQREAPPSRPQ